MCYSSCSGENVYYTLLDLCVTILSFCTSTASPFFSFSLPPPLLSLPFLLSLSLPNLQRRCPRRSCCGRSVSSVEQDCSIQRCQGAESQGWKETIPKILKPFACLYYDVCSFNVKIINSFTARLQFTMSK